MKPHDKTEFSKMIFLTAELYNKELTVSLINLYFKILSRFSIEKVSAGFENHLVDPKNGKFFPRPADIVHQIDCMKRPAKERAIHAWMEIESTMRRVGAYGDCKLKDQQAQIALNSLGSWPDLCFINRDKLSFKRHEFIEIYQALEKASISSDNLNLENNDQNVFAIKDESKNR